MRVVFHETESTRCLCEAIEAHDQTFDLSAGAEEGVDLFFGGVEGEVADVEGGRVLELFFEVGRRCASGAIGRFIGRVALTFLVLEGGCVSGLKLWVGCSMM